MSNEQANEYLRYMRLEAQKSRDGEPVDPEVERTALLVDEIFTKMETGMLEIAERYLPELREANKGDSVSTAQAHTVHGRVSRIGWNVSQDV